MKGSEPRTHLTFFECSGITELWLARCSPALLQQRVRCKAIVERMIGLENCRPRGTNVAEIAPKCPELPTTQLTRSRHRQHQENGSRKSVHCGGRLSEMVRGWYKIGCDFFMNETVNRRCDRMKESINWMTRRNAQLKWDLCDTVYTRLKLAISYEP